MSGAKSDDSGGLVARLHKHPKMSYLICHFFERELPERDVELSSMMIEAVEDSPSLIDVGLIDCP